MLGSRRVSFFSVLVLLSLTLSGWTQGGAPETPSPTLQTAHQSRAAVAALAHISALTLKSAPRASHVVVGGGLLVDQPAQPSTAGLQTVGTVKGGGAGG